MSRRLGRVYRRWEPPRTNASTIHTRPPRNRYNYWSRFPRIDSCRNPLDPRRWLMNEGHLQSFVLDPEPRHTIAIGHIFWLHLLIQDSCLLLRRKEIIWFSAPYYIRLNKPFKRQPRSKDSRIVWASSNRWVISLQSSARNCDLCSELTGCCGQLY